MQRSVPTWPRYLTGLVLLVCSACTTDAVPSKRTEPFIALARDFEGFLAWPRWSIPDIGGTLGHDPGEPRFVYVGGEMPPRGEPFAVGTLIVKTLEVGEPASWEVHAMTKRGGDYNAEGALGWEWFDLALTPELLPVIKWRGEGSAADTGGYVTVDGRVVSCNDCHAIIPATDYVFSRGALE
jgi:hypothetical protein